VRSSLLVAIVAAVALTDVAAAQPTSDLVSQFERQLRPDGDDWETEVLQDRAKTQLDALANVILSGAWDRLDEIAHPEAIATALRRDGTAVEHGRITVLRTSRERGPPPKFTLRAALEELRNAMFADSPGARVELKVVGVRLQGQRAFVTRVRYEGRGGYGQALRSHTGHWEVWWVRGDDPAPPILAAVYSLDLEEVTAEATGFVESTASVVDLDAKTTAPLNHGGESWHGRVDGVGEPNLMGHNGIAIGDANNDGLEDLYVAMGTGLPNLLLVRKPDGTMEDRAAEAGVAWLDDTKGVLFADMDNDGDQDLLMAVGNAIVLAKNRGDGHFGRIVTMRAASPAAFYSLSVCDYDEDGDLDVYGTRYVKVQYGVSVPRPFHDANNGPSNHLLRNEGRDRYRDVTTRSGLGINNNRFSLACTWTDYDLDGDMDLYVANDFGRNNLYRNDRGRFTDVAGPAGVEDQAAGMGVSVGDFDVDGKPDFYVTNMYSAAGNRVAYQSRFASDAGKSAAQIQRFSLGNTLFRNLGAGRFADVSDRARVRMGRWGWGARFIDVTNDGYDDIISPNGFLTGRAKDDL